MTFKPTPRMRSMPPLLAALCLVAGLAQAETGKLRLTGGVSSVEATAGGGITPWAVLGTQATDGEIGVSANLNRLSTNDYGLSTYGVALNLKNTLELSLGRQDLSAQPATALNALGFAVSPNPHLKMDIVGAKLHLMGNAVLDSDNWLPEVAVGLQYKSTQAGSIKPVLDFLGAKTSGTDVYVAATKLFLEQGLLLNATLRYTNANQGGLLGFGSAAPGRNSRSLNPELAVAYLLRKDLAIGAEYRFMPNNLEALGRAAGLGSGLRQDDWKDIFVAWAPTKNVSLTGAYVDLGQVVPGVTGGRKQRGLYLSGQVAY
ncbi:DUF3034 family protein [Curvibacter sp. RS43]|uniref:DUF3034 family protein n=1 Tax=Curvibacter microcysteis TaxID=3026419 RepID=UPI002361174C|nr:DUF3034 family protein [Curvibacter sp. RS43]MDD0812277.1 DUF3034 family protein [Curvibacter sp. RS43]